jgi:hypothetical protein
VWEIASLIQPKAAAVRQCFKLIDEGLKINTTRAITYFVPM